MKVFAWAAACVVLLTSCQAGNLGFYLYPQAASTGVSEIPAVSGGDLEVVGYLPSRKLSQVSLEQTQHLTDLVYFTLAARADGTLARGSLTDAHRDFLRRVKHDYGVRILIAIADHQRHGALDAIVSRPERRAQFVAALVQFLDNEGFDGIDFDWEYPSPSAQTGYVALLQEIHAQFAPRGYRLSVAVSPSRPLLAAAYASVDRVHGMLYDDAGRHSTLQKASDHVQSMVQHGVAPDQLLLGVPFYGRGYTRTGPQWSQAVSYRTLQEKYELSPDQDTVSGFYFNGIETVRRKVQLAKQQGLAGVMIWEIGQDTTGEKSLLGAITAERRNLAAWN